MRDPRPFLEVGIVKLPADAVPLIAGPAEFDTSRNRDPERPPDVLGGDGRPFAAVGIETTRFHHQDVHASACELPRNGGAPHSRADDTVPRVENGARGESARVKKHQEPTFDLNFRFALL
jgi:hypothetical protein